MRWDDHWTNFKLKLYNNPVSDKYAKRELLSNMVMHSYQMASQDCDPEDESMRSKTLQEYEAILRDLFQPGAESDAMRMEYLERKQRPDEHHEQYVRDKYRLWKLAYAAGGRDWSDFFTTTTSGLFNPHARKHMRKYEVPVNPSLGPYAVALTQKGSELRRRYHEGELSYNDVIGMESHAHYRQVAAATAGRRIKSEVNAMSGDVCALGHSNPRRPWNAKGNPNSQPQAGSNPATCWACGSTGHMKRECPRAITGLSTNALESEDTSEDHPEHEDEEAGEVSYLRQDFRKSNRGFQQPSRPRRTFGHGGRNGTSHPRGRIIANLVEDENGDIMTIFTNGNDTATEDRENAAVHFLA
jgi:hypothetical protein